MQQKLEINQAQIQHLQYFSSKIPLVTLKSP